MLWFWNLPFIGGGMLGITGSGLQPTNEIGQLGHMHPEILEDPEMIDDNTNITNQWSEYWWLTACFSFCCQKYVGFFKIRCEI